MTIASALVAVAVESAEAESSPRQYPAALRSANRSSRAVSYARES